MAGLFGLLFLVVFPGVASAKFDAQPQVIGGETAEPGTFPWLAFVAGNGGVCTGSVVSSNLILTAAHCVVDPESGDARDPTNYFVVTGSVDWTEPSRELSAVAQILPFPFYEPSGSLAGWGDAALLHLSSRIQAPSIRLAESKVWDKGTVALIAGWGRTQFEQEDLTEHLQWAPTIVQSDQYCLSNAPGFLPGVQLCAIEAAGFESGACHGDSGGPLLAEAPGAKELVQIGVVHGGYGECRTDMPNLFTRSDLIAAWVAGLIKVLAPPPPVPPSPPPPKSPPTTTVPIEAGRAEPPILGRSQAAVLVRAVLTKTFKRNFVIRRVYRSRCTRPSLFALNRLLCSVTWSHGRLLYRGSLYLVARRIGGTPKVRANTTIRWVNQRCTNARLQRNCQARFWRGVVEVPMNQRH